MRLGSSDVQALLQRLTIGYMRPMTDAEMARAIPVWRDVLDGVPWADLERAVDEAIAKPDRFMPKPGDIRSRALALAGGALKRQYGEATETWAREPWEPGYTPDGVPLLCPKCGGDVSFTVTSPGQYVGHIRHRTTCGTAPRIERAKGDFSMPAPDPAKLAEKRRGYYELAAEAQRAKQANEAAA